jgi:hypothetical protein
MEYLWDLYSVRITIKMAGGKLIFSAQCPYLARQLSVRSTRGRLRTTRQGHQDYSKLSCLTTKYSGACRMDLPGPTTSFCTRTDYSVGPWASRLVPHDN